MVVKFFKTYQGQSHSYDSGFLYVAESVTNDGNTKLVDIKFTDGTSLLGVDTSDIEIYDGSITNAIPPAGCCSRKKRNK